MTVRRRACLVVPGGSEKMIGKAAGLEADEIVFDLEDAVPPSGKDAARRLVVAALEGGAFAGRQVAVRVNAAGTPWHDDDVAAVSASGRRGVSIVLPKVDRPGAVQDVDARLGDVSIGLQALIESAAGLAHCAAIAAASPGLETLILGYADLASSLGRGPDADWTYVRETVLVAARAAGIEAIDGPCFDLTPGSGRLATECDATVALGFAGKWAIHPAQIETIARAFTPSDEAVTRARGVIAALDAAKAAGTGIAVFEGTMIDEAMRAGAQRVLARAGAEQ